MDNIKIKVLNEFHKPPSSTMMFLARLTQRGHSIKSMEDLLDLYGKSTYNRRTLERVAELPHGTIKRFTPTTVAVVGASRRFLAQARTHQVGMTFVSASLQYSDYSDNANFVIPYELAGTLYEKEYLDNCRRCADRYKHLIEVGIDNDTAGYLMPQGLRNILIIQGNNESWAHFIRTRACNRNTAETQYVALRIWQELLQTWDGEVLFKSVGPDCTIDSCREGSFSCGKPLQGAPGEIIKKLFPKLRGA